MILLRRGKVESVVVTVSEKTTINGAFYLFHFTNDTTKATVAFVASNLSVHTARYDAFLVDVDALFVGHKDGFYTYRIYQQHSATNTDPLNSEGLAEIGKMKLVSTKLAIKEYNNSSQYKAYGQ